jgi:uncharacterized protein YxjI
MSNKLSCPSRPIYFVSNIFSDKDSYAITIQPGQDAALMICFAVCIDDIVRLIFGIY